MKIIKNIFKVILLLCLIFILVVWFVLHTTIISDKNPKRAEKIFGFMKKKKKKNK